jgi:tetratricopeptide (TPR) repeat protein
MGQGISLAAFCIMLSAVPLAIVPIPILFPYGIYDYALWPKALVLHLSIALGIVGWMVQTRWGQNTEFVRSPLTLPLLCFLGLAAASSWNTTHPADTLFELFNLAAMVSLYLVTANTIAESKIRTLLWVNTATGLVVALIGILQYQNIAFVGIPSNGPPGATFGYRNFAAMYLICALPLSGLMFLISRSTPAIVLSGLSTALMGVFLIYTRTRGAWLGIALGIVLVSMVSLHLHRVGTGRFQLRRLLLGVGWSFSAWVIYFWTGHPLLWVVVSAAPGWALTAECLSHTAAENRRYHFWLYLFLTASTGGFGAIVFVWIQKALGTFDNTRKAVGLTCVGVILVLSLLPARFNDRGLQRFDENKADVVTAVASVFKDQADRGRRAMWFNTLELIRDHPILGVGAGGWKRAYPEYDRRAMIRLDSMPRRPHNDYLWIASEYGIPALAVYVFLLILAFKQLFRLAREGKDIWPIIAPFLAISLIATLVHAGFSFPRERPQAAMFPFLILGLAAAGSNLSVKRSCRVSGILILSVLLVSTLATVELTRRWINFDRHYLGALLAEDDSNWKRVTEEVHLAQQNGVLRAHLLVLKGRAEEKQQDYVSAERTYEGALAIEPHSWHAHNGMGVVLKRQGRYGEAKMHYEAALKIFPGARVVWNNLGALYKSMGDRAKSESGGIERARSYYQNAEMEYQKVLDQDPFDAGANNNLGNIYKARMQPDSAAVYYERALEAKPDLAQAHHNLADLYRRKRDFKKSVLHFRQAAELNPGEARIFLGLGQTLEAVADLPGAKEAFETALLLKHDFSEVHFSLGNLLFDLGRHDASLQRLERFLELWKGDPKFTEFAQMRITACKKRIGKNRGAKNAPLSP